MIVLKFGGTSVGSAEAIKKVKDIVERESSNQKIIVVVSAFSQVTNKLERLVDAAISDINSANSLIDELQNQHIEVVATLTPEENPEILSTYFNDLRNICKGINLLQEVTKKSNDFIVSIGEVLSSLIISKYFNLHFETELFNSKDYLVTSDKTPGRVNLEVSKHKVLAIADINRVNIFPGFIASTSEGQTTTLGRGGSDYTASVLSNIVNASELQIWTDVSGILSADPKLVKQSRILSQLSYEEALELSHFGAKVIYPPSIQPALEKGIPIKIKNTFEPDNEGTLITGEWDKNKSIIQGISSIKEVVMININGAGMTGIPSFSYRFFKALADNGVNPILITQASSMYSICVAINPSDLDTAKSGIYKEFEEEIASNQVNDIDIERDLSVVALVGSNMRNQVGVSGKMFHALGRNGISVKAIAQGSSERNISAIIPNNNLKKALNVLHESFFLSQRKTINLFIIGVGNVGQAFIKQVEKQTSFLQRFQHLNIRIVGLANSKKMIFNDEGLDLSNWKDNLLDNGIEYTPSQYLDKISELNLRNSVFIDITASKTISDLYDLLLKNNISVVTPNKLAATSPYENFKSLHEVSVRNGVHFLYETNVAAGLPVISTLKDLIRSGDRITKIEAVLSGTLNYLFNTYDGSISFANVIKDAQEKGLTEPDPRLDLFGEDVMRKILILSRECGFKSEMPDVEFESFLPKACHEAKNIDAFYKVVDQNENHFINLHKKARDNGEKLRVVASFENGKAKVALEGVSSEHPFYNLEGKDNIVLFYTNRYSEQPLVVKGAGAGADVTASGIFADILKVSNG